MPLQENKESAKREPAIDVSRVPEARREIVLAAMEDPACERAMDSYRMLAGKQPTLSQDADGSLVFSMEGKELGRIDAKILDSGLASGDIVQMLKGNLESAGLHDEEIKAQSSLNRLELRTGDMTNLSRLDDIRKNNPQFEAEMKVRIAEALKTNGPVTLRMINGSVRSCLIESANDGSLIGYIEFMPHTTLDAKDNAVRREYVKTLTLRPGLNALPQAALKEYVFSRAGLSEKEKTDATVEKNKDGSFAVRYRDAQGVRQEKNIAQ